jgi:hypothetical protein
MRPSLSQIPSGRVAMPKSTVPHLQLAGLFRRLANRHSKMAMANAPDPATARLPRPDMAALNVRKGRAQVRQPLIGSPNPADY